MNIMLIELIIMLLIVGGALYILQIVPIAEPIKRVIYVVVVIAVIIYLLRNFVGSIL